uniref:CCZ1/INTU/HSP4 first Longin domain-containing protein n=1 Tax=Panagrolaimus superbus TaxID=310955 RepID=A0A914XW57_9BILA
MERVLYGKKTAYMMSPGYSATTPKSEFLKLIDLMEYFFVSRPASGRREGFEYQRVMYFNPETENSSKQTDVSGVAEAFIAFTENFRKRAEVVAEYDHRFVKSTKLLEIFVQVENSEYIIGLGLNRQACNEHDYFVHMSSLKALLIRTYETFRLFYGTFSDLFETGKGILMQRLDQFFSHYLSLLRVHQIPLIDLFSGVGFMNMPPVDYLDVQCLISRCSESFPMIKKTLFLYQDKMVEYSVSKNDIIVVYRYLTQHLVQSAVQSELKPVASATYRETETKKFIGKFITGVTEDFIGQEESVDHQFPNVFLSDDNGKMISHALIAYRALNATFCLFVKNEDMPSLDLQELQQSLDSELSRLASNIGDNVSSITRTITSSDIPFHYVYYNPDSLSLKTSFVDSPSDLSNVPLPPPAIYKQVCETFDHFIDTDTEKFAQVCCKADDDWWVVVKKVNGRVLTLFIPSTPTSNITDIHDIVEQIIKSYFLNLFIV